MTQTPVYAALSNTSLDEAQVGDVEEDVLHVSGGAGVGVGGGQHQVLLSVESGVERLQLLQREQLDQLPHHRAVDRDEGDPGAGVWVLQATSQYWAFTITAADYYTSIMKALEYCLVCSPDMII